MMAQSKVGGSNCRRLRLPAFRLIPGCVRPAPIRAPDCGAH